MEIELEKTYLVKEIPPEIKGVIPTEILDIYIPSNTKHPILRIRKRGNNHSITKKKPIHGTDSSEQSEETILLSEEEFTELSQIKGKRLRKNRYTIKNDGITLDLDIFLDDLEGLVLVDFEFSSVEAKNSFVIPNWCVADVTQDELIAGGVLAGKKYLDIENGLKNYGYTKINNR